MTKPGEEGAAGTPDAVDPVIIGMSTQNGTEVSVQQIQQIFHELTGNTEATSKIYTDPFQISFEHLEQLNSLVTQALEQYNIISQQCTVSIFYTKSTRDKFKSFERFRSYQKGSSKPVERILLKYNFLLLLPLLQQPQMYEITIHIISRVALYKKMRNELQLTALPGFIKFISDGTANVKVEFIDYAVARNLMSTIDDWFESLPKASTSPVWRKIRQRSEYLPIIAKYVTGALVAVWILLNFPEYLSEESSFSNFAQVFWCACIVLFATYRIAHHLGQSAETSLDNWNELSYLNLTAGDSNLVKESELENSGSVVWAVIKFSGAILNSLIVKLVVFFSFGI